MDGQRPLLEPSLLAALRRVGLELQESGGGETAYLVSGNTFPHRELLKGCGGRWSQRRQSWVFESAAPVERLAAALPPEGAPGLADAPATFEAEAASFSRRRKSAQPTRQNLNVSATFRRFLPTAPGERHGNRFADRWKDSDAVNETRTPIPPAPMTCCTCGTIGRLSLADPDPADQRPVLRIVFNARPDGRPGLVCPRCRDLS